MGSQEGPTEEAWICIPGLRGQKGAGRSPLFPPAALLQQPEEIPFHLLCLLELCASFTFAERKSSEPTKKKLRKIKISP